MEGKQSPAAAALAAALSQLDPDYALLDWELDFAARLAQALRAGEVHSGERPRGVCEEFGHLARAVARSRGGDPPATTPPAVEMLWLAMDWVVPALRQRGLDAEAGAIGNWKRAFATTSAGREARQRFFEFMGIQDVHRGAPQMPMYAHHLIERVQASVLASA